MTGLWLLDAVLWAIGLLYAGALVGTVAMAIWIKVGDRARERDQERTDEMWRDQREAEFTIRYANVMSAQPGTDPT
jgi:hypothetical protein